MQSFVEVLNTLVKRIRLAHARITRLEIGEWHGPIVRIGYSSGPEMWRLTADGEYEYRPCTPEESADYVSGEAW